MGKEEETDTLEKMAGEYKKAVKQIIDCTKSHLDQVLKIGKKKGWLEVESFQDALEELRSVAEHVNVLGSATSAIILAHQLHDGEVTVVGASDILKLLTGQQSDSPTGSTGQYL